MSKHLSPKLLIVDDEDDLREGLAKHFEKNGLRVVTAASGAEALLEADKDRFDVALLDVHMPDMTGIDLLGKLKERWPQIEAIMLTGHGSIETAIRAMKLGAYDYLAKPVHLPPLDVHIDKAFEKVRLARRERQWVEQIAFQSDRYRLVGSSQAMKRVLHLIEKVGPDRGDGADLRGQRHGQGTGGPGPALQQPAPRTAARDRQLCRPAGKPARKRAFWP